MQTRILTLTAASVLLMANLAMAQATGTPDSGGNAGGGATGATSGPGSVDSGSGATGGTGGPVTQTKTGAGPAGNGEQGTSQPSNNCDPAKADQAGSATNQNMATGGCMK